MSQSREAIAALVHGYAERLDSGDFAGVAQLFARATYGASVGEALRGAPAVLDVLERLVLRYEGIPRTKHVVTNLTIDVDEASGTAAARSYFTVLQATGALPLQPIIAGRYRDEFARDEDGWYFTERRIFIDLTGDISQHLERFE